MITCLLNGGLGNQMFQIAAAYNLSLELGVDFLLSTELSKNISQKQKIEKYINNIFSKIKFGNIQVNKKNIYREKKFSYDPIPFLDNQILVGYFQSYKYFEKNEDKIRDLFLETEEINIYMQNKYKNINFEKSVSLHVRRGDYLKYPDTHPVCSKSYYDKALVLLDGQYESILIFSNDQEWCKNNLKYKNCVFIQDLDYIELYLMSKCKNNIIANSSFSWWAAWMNSNKNKKVVYPKVWFGPKGPKDTEDLCCISWKSCE